MTEENSQKQKDIVVPGEILSSNTETLPGRNTFKDGNDIVAKRLGIANSDGRVVSVLPLNIVYQPRVGDMIIGEIKEVQSNGWVVDVRSLNEAFLPLSGVKEYIDTSKTSLSRYYNVGDLIYTKIASVQGSIYLTMQDIKSKKFRGGRVVKINPAKVPRLIGRQGSMIMLIKDRTDSRINVGQNGLVWVEGENASKAVAAIEMIQKDSLSEGLTDKIAAFLGPAQQSQPTQPNESSEPVSQEESQDQPVVAQEESHE